MRILPSTGVYIIFFAFFLNSCRDNPVPVTAPMDRAPVVRGIVRVYEDGRVGGTIGSPETTKNKSGYINIGYAYPNPADHEVSFSMKLEKKCNVTGWLTKAKADNALYKVLPYGTNTLQLHDGLAVLVFVKDILAAGTHEVEFETTNLDEGFYRIYIRADDELAWTDLLILR